MNQSDVLTVIKVVFADLSASLYSRAISKDGVKICVKPKNQCTIQNHRKQAAQFIPKSTSSLGVYVLITVSGQINIFWFNSSATIEKVGVRFEQSW